MGEQLEEHDVAAWASALSSLRDYIMVELCDPRGCEGAATLLTRFFQHAQLRDHALQVETCPCLAGDSYPLLICSC